MDFDPVCWHDCQAFVRGVELFNAQHYWHSHEQFEKLWHAAGRRGATADFLKGLIKLAAAGVKHQQGVAAGVRSHARRAAELWRQVGGDRLFGLPLSDLIELAQGIDRDGWPATPPVLRPQP